MDNTTAKMTPFEKNAVSMLTTSYCLVMHSACTDAVRKMLEVDELDICERLPGDDELIDESWRQLFASFAAIAAEA